MVACDIISIIIIIIIIIIITQRTFTIWGAR